MDLQIIDYFGKGTLLGLAAGFSPGPLTVLVIGTGCARASRWRSRRF
jgi:threonine/homoserine/homoserine lactone efflux protein